MRPPRARLCLGKRSRCSVLLKFLRPLKVVAEAIVNPVKDQRLDDLIAVSREVTTWGGKTFISIFYQSATIPSLLHSAKRWATVIEQRSGKIWGGEPDTTAAAAPVTPNKQNELIADFIFNAQNRAEDITLIWAMGFEVDDDNELAPSTSQQTMHLCLGWGGVSTKGRSGDGTGSIRGPRSGEQYTMGHCLRMGGLPSGRRSLRSSSTSSPSNSSQT
jgi:hypothetical protein